MSTTNCIWTYDDNMDAWETECGNAFVIVEGAPIENDMLWCPYCGKNLLDAETAPQHQEG